MSDEITLRPYQRDYIRDKSQIKILVASRQIGKTYATLVEIVLDSLAKRNNCWLIFSRTEALAMKLLEDINPILEEISKKTGHSLKTKKNTATKIVLPNGSKIFSKPSAPDSSRSYTSNIYFDEFAFHLDQEAVWASVAPAALSTGLRILITTTPNGHDKTYRLLNTPTMPAYRKILTIEEAVANGAPHNIDLLRSAFTEKQFNREYMCSFEDMEGSAFKLEEFIRKEAEVQYDDIILSCDTSYFERGDGQAIMMLGSYKHPVTHMTCVDVLDWWYFSLDSSFLIEKLEPIIKENDRRYNYRGIYFEPRSSGVVLSNTLKELGHLVITPTASWLKYKKDERVKVLGHALGSSRIGITEYAFTKEMDYKGLVDNHFLIAIKDYKYDFSRNQDDLIDTLVQGAYIMGVV